jgi:hypothetical protein
MNTPRLFYRLRFRVEKQMKKFLLVTFIGFVLAALAALGAPQPLVSPTAVLAQAECACKDLKTLQIELRNALRLQQAFHNKIPELRTMEIEGRKSMAELQRWSASDARRGLEELPGHSGAAQVDYKPWGDHLNYQDDERVTAKFTNEELCRRSDESAAALEEEKNKSACAGIAQAIQVHEDWHLNFCRTIGYRPYWLGMHGADRAQEEVEAYDKQIAVLRAEIAKVLKKNCVSYRASGNAGGDTVFSGDICDLEKPFNLKTNNPFLGSFEFVPSSSSGGKWSFSTTNGVIGGGGGTYTITGSDTEKTGIEMNGWSTGTVRGATRSGGGTVHINLVPLDKECKP